MEAPDSISAVELERFRSIRWLRNHWSDPIGPKAYYWYLTFENSPELRSLCKKCQEAIAFPYYDPTPLSALHLTLARIASENDITMEQLGAIEAAAIDACRDIRPFAITIGSLGGTRGAVGFAAYPTQPIRRLHDILCEATLSVYPDVHIRDSEFHPHVTIAYANTDDMPASETIAAVESLNATARVNVTIREGAIVLLDRRQRSYAWQVIARIPLGG